MKKWLQLNIRLNPVQPYADILIALLSEEGFDFFTETEDGLIAYTEEGKVSRDTAVRILESIEAQKEYNFLITEDQNWNAKWEESFSPIDLPNKCRIRAPFHDEMKGVLNVIIEPKMSFGTGHHATTYMMMEIMFDYSDKIKEAKVLDMGCGTGVLAIIAEKLNASFVDAIDIDLWSYENTIENVTNNKCNKVNVIHGDRNKIPDVAYDIVLANINKNILKNELQFYAKRLNKNGLIALSGFFVVDCNDLKEVAEKENLSFIEQRNHGDWASMIFEKK